MKPKNTEDQDERYDETEGSEDLHSRIEATKIHSGSMINNQLLQEVSSYLVSEGNGRASYVVAKRAANMGASIIQTIHRTQERAQERRRSRKEICYGNEIVSLFTIIHKSG